MKEADVIGAFSEEDACRLSGVSIGQLRAWDRRGFFLPSFAAENRRQPYSRVYSFRDIVALRVLNSLRNEHHVSMQHLRKVSHELAHLGEERWTKTTLYVLGRRVVFTDPRTSTRREVVGGQGVFDIPLRVAISSTKEAISEMNRRHESALGHVVADRFVLNNRPVFEGTRIPVSAVTSYIERGIGVAEILREFPELRAEDVEAARKRREADAA